MSNQDDHSKRLDQLRQIEDHLADILEGTASAALYDAVAESDEARDLRHDAQRATELVAQSGGDFIATDDLGDRTLDKIWATRPDLRAELPVGELPATHAESGGGSAGAAQLDGAQRDGAELDGAPGMLDSGQRTLLSGVERPVDLATAPTTLAPLESAQKHEPAPTTDPLPLQAASGSVDAITHKPVASGETVTGAISSGAVSSGEGLQGNDAPHHEPTIDLVDRNLGLLDRNVAAAEVGSPPARVIPIWRRRNPIIAASGVLAAVAAAAATYFLVPTGTDETEELAEAAVWTGEVSAVARASADESGGLEICDASGACELAVKGAEVTGGSTLKTDARTRARVKLADGSWISLDRSSVLTLPGGEARVATLAEGVIVADVAHVEGAEPARFIVSQGEVEVLGTKLAITSVRDRVAIEVARGEVRLHPESGEAVEIRAGEEATMIRGGAPIVASTTSLADMLEWSDVSPDEVDAPVLRGLGELKAKKPGETKERDGAVRLTKHSVKVRVVDVVARTTIDETFTNQTDEELEGIFRFPLPPGAQIEKLALEVDGELIDGAFVDRDRGAAIWRGVLFNAAPKAPRPRDEIVWVPGPWRDPALLEWQRGGRFELKIFPIPKKSSRRVVLTYTQIVDQAAGVRRFSYPLAHDPSGSTVIDDFDIDVQVIGHDPELGVSTRGYELAAASGSGGALGGQRFTMNAKQFVPAGDLTVEYALENRDKEITAWAYKMPDFAKTQALAKAGAPSAPARQNAGPVTAGVATSAVDPKQAARDLLEDDSAYVAISLRPKLPRWQEARERLHVIVVDSSRSMFGERFARASRLASAIVREMDRRDTFMVLACDTTCQGMGAGAASRLLPSAESPSAQAAGEVESFLGRIEPDGGSDLRAVVEAARAAAGSTGGRELRIIYLGDGTPSVGPIQTSHLEAAVRQTLPDGSASLIAVALGTDADTKSLAAMARGGGGVVVPYVPGQRVAAAALDVLSAAYGVILRDAIVELPPGLEQVAPARLDPIPAGGERFVVARMSGDRVEGSVVLRGRVAGESFEQTYPATIVATDNPGNAFVPRLFAAQRISDLEQAGENQKAKVIELSKRFAVASRFTSLIVLESEAMFDAFGLDRGSVAPLFTGELAAQSESADADGEEEYEASVADAIGGLGLLDAPAEGKKAKADSSASGFGSTGAAPGGGFAQAPAAEPAPPPMTPPQPSSGPIKSGGDKPPPAAKPSLESQDFFGDDAARRESARDRRPQNLVPMRRVFDRNAQFIATGLLAEQNASKVAAAEAELSASPDSRDKTVALYRLLSTTNRLGEASELTARWASRDALDPEALLARADLAARLGDRDRAVRILGGLADVRPGDRTAQERLASLHDFAGNRALACEHRIALGDLAPGDAKLVANAVRCAREQGMNELASLMQADVTDAVRREVERLLPLTPPDPLNPVLTGDVRVTASWTGGEDLDIALIDDKGQRVSWLGSFGTIRVAAKDAQSASTESISLSGMPSGNFTLEVSRARPSQSNVPISGTVTLRLVNETRTVPFTITDKRADLGTVRVFFTSRLVPIQGIGGNLGWR